MKQIINASKEFYEIMYFFENSIIGSKQEKEDKSLWVNGYYYTNGNINSQFKMFLSGCNYGISMF